MSNPYEDTSDECSISIIDDDEPTGLDDPSSADAEAIASWLPEALRLARSGRKVMPGWWVLPDGHCACGDENHMKARKAGRHPLVKSHAEASSDPQTIKK